MISHEDSEKFNKEFDDLCVKYGVDTFVLSVFAQDEEGRIVGSSRSGVHDDQEVRKSLALDLFSFTILSLISLIDKAMGLGLQATEGLLLGMVKDSYVQFLHGKQHHMAATEATQIMSRPTGLNLDN